MISFDGGDSGTNSGVLVSFLLDVGTFVGRFSFTVLALLGRRKMYITIGPMRQVD